MTTSTLPYTAPSAPGGPGAPSGPSTPGTPASPSFWHAPFSAVTYREFGYTVTSFAFALVSFTFGVTMVSLGASLAVTVLGLPLLAAALAGARGLGAAERQRARTQLGLDVGEPASRPAPRNPGWWSGVLARLTDTSGWKALLFHVAMFPWRVTSFCVSLTVLATAWTMALLPLYSWVFPTFVDWPGYKVFDYDSGGTHHAYYLSSPFQIAGVALLGLVIVFLTPKVMRALTNVDRAAVRSLLG